MQLDTIPVYVRDQDAALAWYTGKLGFEAVRDQPMGPGQRWLEVAPPGSEVRLVLYRATEDQPGVASLREAEARIGTFTGYVFSTDDVERDHRDLTAQGVTFTMAPDRQPWGTFAVFTDPDGNGFGLMQPPG